MIWHAFRLDTSRPSRSRRRGAGPAAEVQPLEARVVPTVTVFGGADAVIAEGGTFTRNGSYTDNNGAATAWTATVDYGDGSGVQALSLNQGAKTFSLSHLYADDGNYTVTVVVSNNAPLSGDSGSDTIGVTATNVAPTVTVSGAASVNEGSSYAVTISGLTDPGADTVTGYTVSWGDGTADTTVTAAALAAANGVVGHVYADGAAGGTARTVTVSATDEDGTFVAGSKSLTVDNVAPAATVSGANSVNEGSSYSVTISNVTDPGADTITGYTISWGDGTADTVVTAAALAAANGVVTHVYADGGSGGTARTATVSATDEDGTFQLGTQNLTVNNVAPTAANKSASVAEGGVLSGTVSGTDPAGANDPLTVTAVNGNGASVGQTVTLASGARLTLNANRTFTYDPNGAFRRLRAGRTATDTFTFTLSDGDGGTSRGTVTVTIQGRGADDLIGYYAGGWWVGKSNGGGFDTTKWAQWNADTRWDALLNADVNGDGRVDVVGMVGGQWHVGLSTGGGFTTSLAATWSATAWKDAAAADINGDGKADLLARVGGQWWASLSTGSGFAAATPWADWSAADWGRFEFKDLTGDGKADLLGYVHGEWYAAVSTGTSFGPASLWAKWSDSAWTSYGTGDFDGDGRADVYGFVGGEWYVGRSTGSAFATGLRARWANAAWQDGVVGDFDGDGRDDVAARVGGQWYVGKSNASGGQASLSLWASWADAAWKDVRVGDFNGDGKADIAGRSAGDWYVGASGGAGFSTAYWGHWADVEWRAVRATDFDGDAVTALTSGGGGEMLAPTAASPARGQDRLSLFWAQSDRDEDLLSGLLAV